MLCFFFLVCLWKIKYGVSVGFGDGVVVECVDGGRVCGGVVGKMEGLDGDMIVFVEGKFG